MTGKEYIENAIKNGKNITRCYANGLAYVFIKEPDGWISILQRQQNGDYIPKIQAKDEPHAKSYINMIEPLAIPANII